MPNSLTVNHSSALVCSTQLRVSVYGTGTLSIQRLADFLGSLITHISDCASTLGTVGFLLYRRICLPVLTHTAFNHLFRQMAVVSLLRPHITHISSTGILTRSSIGLAVRRNLRARLTLIRLALIRKPESFGVQVSHLHYRYLYLHLLFYTLQQKLSFTFNAE